MNNKDHKALWEQCLKLIQASLPAEQFDVWFKDVSSYQYADNKLTLSVPSSFFVEQLEERFINVLGSAIKKVYGPGVSLYYSFYQIKDQPDTVVHQLSSSPSTTILESKKPQGANQIGNDAAIEIDPQLNPRYTFDNYCASECNKMARVVAESIADNPKNLTFSPLFIFGDTGVGKTHLIQAIGIRIKEHNPQARVLYVTARLFESQYTTAVANKNTNNFFHFYQSIDTLIVDDIQDLKSKPGTQNTFFHIFNHLHQNNKQIILSSDCAPYEMEGFEDRLTSRFKWGMQAQLEKPDLALRRKVLELKARQNGLDIPTEVIEYIAVTVTDSIRDLEGVIVSLIAHATVMSSDITLSLAKSVIERAVKPRKRVVDFELIAEEVCSLYKISTDMLFTKTRKRDVSDARQVVMYLAKEIGKMSLVAIGNKLGRTHATVNYACRIIEERLLIDKQLQTDIGRIQASLQS